jgi:hypothetical protein
MDVQSMPKVGDFMYSSWGYDQTNIEFYKVVRVSDASVWLQEYESKIVEQTGWASETVIAGDSPKTYWGWECDEDGNSHRSVKKTAGVFRKKWHGDGYFNYVVSMNSFANAYKWDGKAKHATHYA